MKKAVTMLLIFALLLSFAACAEKTDATANDKENVAIIPETAAPETTVPETAAPEATVPETTIPETTVPETTVPETTVPETTVPETVAPEQSEMTADGLRVEFKEAMDSYEAFYDEYCDFMLKYKENPSDWKLLLEYADMLAKLTEMQASFEKWESEELNNAELAYYIEVNGRITQKLLEIA